ncbi:MAG: SpoIIE family protein phosphatase [Candidatus Brocadiia bacterium]
MPRLTVSHGEEPAREVRLGELTLVGRDPDADVVLASDAVSRHHARISRTEEGYLLEDLWSRNGTFVNRRRVRRRLLRDGDQVDISDFSLVFQAPDEEDREDGQPRPTVVSDDGEAPGAEPLAVPVGLDGSLAAEADREELERLRARLQALYQVTDAVAATEASGEFLEEALAKLLEIFPQADVVVVMLEDRATGAMVPRASQVREGIEPSEVRVSGTVLRRTARRRRALLSRAAGRDPRWRATVSIRRHSIASLMCVPLLERGEVRGLLYVDSRRPGVAFGQEDLEVLTWVGKELRLALERVRMRRELLRRERVERDLRLAAEVQRSFLPEGPPSVPGCEFALHHVAAQGVGGDFYDFLPLGDGRHALVIGEVAGRGIAAALLMARLTSQVRFLSLDCEAPGELLGRLNASLVERAPRGTFVTMLYGVLDPAARRLTLASAAHEPPLRVLAEPGRVEVVDLPRQFPLGALEGSDYEELTVQLERGDHLVLYTDGVIDASNAAGEWYGENRLQRVLAAAPREPQALLDALLADVGAFADEAGESDDMTVVVFRAGEDG